jgi:hypothetical protein
MAALKFNNWNECNDLSQYQSFVLRMFMYEGYLTLRHLLVYVRCIVYGAIEVNG